MNVSRLPIQAFVATRVDSSGAEIPEIQVTLPYSSLVFHRVDGRYEAGYTATAVALRDGRRVGGGVATTDVAVDSYDETRGKRKLYCRVPLMLRGEGTVEIYLTVQGDETARQWRKRLGYRPQAARDIPLFFSDFGWNLDAEEDLGGLGVGIDTLEVTVELGRRPSHEDWPVGGVALVGSIGLESEERILQQRIPVSEADAAAGTLSLRMAWAARDMPFGPAELILELEGELADRTERLTLDPPRRFANLQISWWDERAWKRHVAWLDGLIADERQDFLRDLPDGGRLDAWRTLWTDLAEGRNVSPRALERRHLQRIIEADVRFGGFSRGSMSDRGRTYIRYGPPDKIEAYGDDMTREGRWVIWYYLDQRLRFTFYDPHGLGDYYLYESGLI